VTVAVIAAIRFYREGLARLFADRDGFELAGSLSGPVTGPVTGSVTAPARIRELDPDVVLMALDSPGAVDLVRDVVAAAPRSRVVALGISDDDGRVVALAEAGVAGYVDVDAGASEVVAVVASVARGEMPCSPRIGAVLLQRVAVLARSHAEPPPPPAPVLLTAREREIFALIGRGLSNKEVARDLCIELSTVKNHVHHVLEKLGVSRRGDAVMLLRNRAQI
jgi:DNA-binding NarL/FixJ family response regulator